MTLEALLVALNDAASNNGCVGDYEDESCWSAEPLAPGMWCSYCLHQEAAKVILALRAEHEQAGQMMAATVGLASQIQRELHDKLRDAEAKVVSLQAEQAQWQQKVEAAKADTLRVLASGMRKVLSAAEVDLVVAEIQRGIARDARLAEPDDTGPHGPRLAALTAQQETSK